MKLQSGCCHGSLRTIRNIINTRKSLIARFKADAFVPALDLTHSKSDKEFIEKLKSRNYKNLQLYTKYFNEGTHLSFFPNAFTIGLKTCYKK